MVLKPGTVGFGQVKVPVGHDCMTKHSTESLPHGFDYRLGKQFQTQLSETEGRWPAQYVVNSGIDGRGTEGWEEKAVGKMC